MEIEAMEIIHQYQYQPIQIIEYSQQRESSLEEQEIDLYDISTEDVLIKNSNYDFQSELEQTNFYIINSEEQAENTQCLDNVEIEKCCHNKNFKKKKIHKGQTKRNRSQKKNLSINKHRGRQKDYKSRLQENLDFSNKSEYSSQNLFSNITCFTNAQKSEGNKEQNINQKELQFQNERKNLSRYFTNRLKEIWKEVKSEYQKNNIDYMDIEQLFNNKNTSIKNIKKILNYNVFKQIIVSKYIYTGKLYNMIMNIDMKLQNKAIYIKYYSQMERAIEHPAQFQNWN